MFDPVHQTFLSAFLPACIGAIVATRQLFLARAHADIARPLLTRQIGLVLAFRKSDFNKFVATPGVASLTAQQETSVSTGQNLLAWQIALNCSTIFLACLIALYCGFMTTR